MSHSPKGRPEKYKRAGGNSRHSLSASFLVSDWNVGGCENVYNLYLTLGARDVPLLWIAKTVYECHDSDQISTRELLPPSHPALSLPSLLPPPRSQTTRTMNKRRSAVTALLALAFVLSIIVNLSGVGHSLYWIKRDITLGSTHSRVLVRSPATDRTDTYLTNRL